MEKYQFCIYEIVCGGFFERNWKNLLVAVNEDLSSFMLHLQVNSVYIRVFTLSNETLTNEDKNRQHIQMLGDLF